MSNNLAVTKPEKLQDLIKKPEYAARFEAVLGKRSPQFLSSLLSLDLGPDVDPKSILAAGMMAASLDLPVNKNFGFAWIIPYRQGNEPLQLAQFQVGYKGYIQLSLRSGTFQRMNACPINIEAFAGYDEIGEPIVDWKKWDALKPAAAYFFGFRQTNGFVKTAVWTLADCEAHADRFSKSYKKGNAIWREFRDEMFTKTVVSNELKKWGTMSVDIQTALFLDQRAAKDIDAPLQWIDGSSVAGVIGNGGENSANVATASSTAVAGASGPGRKANPDEAAEAAAGLAPEIKTGTPTAQQQQAQTTGETEEQRLARLNENLKSRQMDEQAKRDARRAPPQTTSPARAAGPGNGLKTSPQELLAKGCTEHGITFDQFRAWASGAIRDADSLTTWEELPGDLCTQWLLAGEALYAEISDYETK